MTKIDICKKTINLPVGNFYIYDNFIIVEANEGITVTQESNIILEDIVNTYFASKNFVYITHRINSYAVDPLTYTRTSQINNLIGFAVVSKNYIALSNTEIEKIFLKKPFQVFDDLDKAKDWALSLIKKEE